MTRTKLLALHSIFIFLLALQVQAADPSNTIIVADFSKEVKIGEQGTVKLKYALEQDMDVRILRARNEPFKVINTYDLIMRKGTGVTTREFHIPFDTKPGGYSWYVQMTPINSGWATGVEQQIRYFQVIADAHNAPSLAFNYPHNGDRLPVGSNLQVEVLATDYDGIDNVKLYISDQLVREETTALYEWGQEFHNDHLLQNLGKGTYTLRAVATNIDGISSADTIKISIEDVITSSLTIEAERYDTMGGQPNSNFLDDAKGHGVQITPEGVVNWVNTGDWMEYNVDIPQTAEYAIVYKVATPFDNSQVQFILDGKIVATDNISKTGTDIEGWNELRLVRSKSKVKIEKGLHTIKLLASSDESWQWSMDNFTLTNEIVNTKEEKSQMTEVIYPSPFLDQILIKSNVNIERIVLANRKGAPIKEFELNRKNAAISTESVYKGQYIINILSENNTWSSYTLIKL